MTTAEKLRQLAPTHTQAEAAAALQITKQRVHQVASEHGIVFVEHRRRTVARCEQCRSRTDGAECLRCKWTPARIKRLRRRLRMSQVAMSLALGMNIYAVHRWEREIVKPSADSLRALDAIERSGVSV